jgi:trypsin
VVASSEFPGAFQSYEKQSHPRSTSNSWWDECEGFETLLFLESIPTQSGGIRIFVVVNNTNLDGNNPFGHVRKVVKIVTHPKWNQTTLRNDLLLLLLDQPVYDIDPVPYTRYTPVVSGLDSFMILGLGLLEYEGNYPEILQAAEVDITSFEKCNDTYSGNKELEFLSGLSDLTQFCASSPGHDACQGDSGGPLVMISSLASDIQLGIVSFGYGCANKDYPGRYAE